MIFGVDPGARLYTTALVAVVGALALQFAVKLWRTRSFIRRLRARGMPMPDHNPFLGHLLQLKSASETVPADVMPSVLFGRVGKPFVEQGAFYVDLWPVMDPFLVVIDPKIANQAVQTSDVGYVKPPALQSWFGTLAGGPSIFTSNGYEWKHWRAVFNPGFSNSHLLTLIPHIVEETELYVHKLEYIAHHKDMVQLDLVTLRFAMDLIGRSVLNDRFKCQGSPGDYYGRNQFHPFADSMLKLIEWQHKNKELNPLVWLDFRRHFSQWNYGRRMNKYIGQVLDERWEVLKKELKKTDAQKSKSVIDLTLQHYASQSADLPDSLNPEFRAAATRQIRTFLFAGHDSTSSTIAFLFYTLSQNPKALRRLRDEHDEVLGEYWDKAGEALKRNPNLINDLTYTQAVIKETLRLHPVAASIRQGLAGVDLVAEDGAAYPTEGTMVYLLHDFMHRSPKYWPRPDEFLPERWLVGPEDPLYPPKGVWRAFERGPRSCPGEALVMVELRVVLAMTVREFNFKPAYDEWDKRNRKKGLKLVDGERAYLMEGGAAHPSDHLPCRIERRGVDNS